MKHQRTRGVASRHQRTFFVTGTDTGVGKTVLTALLLVYLRESGIHAAAMKPFCSGGRSDARILWRLQDGEFSLDEINPYHYRQPLAPAVAAQKEGNPVRKSEVLRRIRAMEKRCQVLLVEGCGGILVPLGENYTVRDVVSALQCPTIVVAWNRLGVINQVSLTVESLKQKGISDIRVVLMRPQRTDLSAQTNRKFLEKTLDVGLVLEVSYLDFGVISELALKNSLRKIKKTLALVLSVR